MRIDERVKGGCQQEVVGDQVALVRDGDWGEKEAEREFPEVALSEVVLSAVEEQGVVGVIMSGTMVTRLLVVQEETE